MSASIQLPLNFERPSRKAGRSKRPINVQRPSYHFDFSGEQGFGRKTIGAPNIRDFYQQDWVIDRGIFTAIQREPLLSCQADWLSFAMAVYCADRFSPRFPFGIRGARFWRRSISLKLSVAEPDRWNAAKPDLIHALEFLTGDDWDFVFQTRKHAFGCETQAHLPMEIRRNLSWVALFSGGLDSLAGVLNHSAIQQSPGLLVSGFTHGRLRDAQDRLVSELQSASAFTGDHLPVKYSLNAVLDDSGMESSQRCRGWIHVAMGLLAAQLAETNELHVFENGIGAFNLPCFRSQSGSQSSLAMHPIFLARVSAAASKLLGRSLAVVHPYALSTKAQMLDSEPVRVFPGTIKNSISCEQYPNYHSKKEQCGVCPSCLFRRSAVFSAKLPDPGNLYTRDVMVSGRPRSLKGGRGLVMLENLVRRLAVLNGPNDQLNSFLLEFPDFAEQIRESAEALNLGEELFLARFLEMQNRFAQEWDGFAQIIEGLRHSLKKAA